MALWEIALVVLALLGILWTVLLVRVLRALEGTAQRIDRLLGEVELNLGPILSHARETSENLHQASAAVAAGLARVSQTATVVGSVGKSVRGGVTTLLGGIARVVPVAELTGKLGTGLDVLQRALRRKRHQ